jgi:hypothetical protein
MSETLTETFTEALAEVFSELEPSLQLNVRSGKSYGDLFLGIVKREPPFHYQPPPVKLSLNLGEQPDKTLTVTLQYAIYAAGIFYDYPVQLQKLLGEQPFKQLTIQISKILGEQPFKQLTVTRELYITPQS